MFVCYYRCLYMCACVYTCACIRVHARLYTYIYTCMRVCIHCTCVPVFACVRNTGLLKRKAESHLASATDLHWHIEINMNTVGQALTETDLSTLWTQYEHSGSNTGRDWPLGIMNSNINNGASVGRGWPRGIWTQRAGRSDLWYPLMILKNTHPKYKQKNPVPIHCSDGGKYTWLSC